MNKNYFLIVYFLLFILQPISFYGQTYNRIITDKEYYDFINYTISNDSFKVTHHVFRKRIPLKSELIFYKDSIEYSKKNLASNCTDFIFHYRVINGMVFSNFIDTIFTRADIDFFGRQLDEMRKNKHWKKPFENSILIDSVEYNYNGKGPFGREMKHGVGGYSLPLFSNDRTKALIIKSNSVSIAYFIYKRSKNGGWDFIKEFNTWALDYF